jgi:predicted RNA-binding Zn ribbon-like protein
MRKRCPCHLDTLPLSYIARSAAAELRIARGERQRQCPDCGSWFFGDEMNTPTGGTRDE